MTLEEKIAMLHGNGLFSTAGVPRLGIPELTYTDGPLGIREEINRDNWNAAKWTTDSATFFPNGSAMAATWNPSLLYRYGEAMGEEARARKKEIVLSPAFNITRTPLNGRTYEYYSEDPFLNAQLAVASVKGIQSKNVAACIKHYAANSQETNRSTVNSVMDERTLHEIYLPAFKAAVQKGNAYTIMSAYNKFRGVWCGENDYLLNKILKQEWGFKGIVVSDWGGTHSTVDAANNGLDIEMGSDGTYDKWFFANPLLDSVKAGKVSVSTIDEKVKRILWVMEQTSLKKNRIAGEMNTAKHSKAVYDIAAEAVVLLKNDAKLLPLKPAGIKSIAVIGDNATRKFSTGGFGAGVKAKYEVTALEGIKSRFGKTANVQYAPGYKATYLPGTNGQRGEPNNAVNQQMIDEAVELASNSEVAILFVGSTREYETEATDRQNLDIPFGQPELIRAVTKANPKTIVVFIAGAPYDLAELKQNNQTLVWSWFNGSENGNVIADVLSGAINPSGKLPFSVPVKLEDSPAHNLRTFPGENLTSDYKEGILVGYRWYDTKKIEPLYSFGYGLSYTKFAYSAIKTDKQSYKAGDKIITTFKLKNIGKVSGKETVQLYVGDNKSEILKAEKELKGFKKVSLAPGQESLVSIVLDVNDLAYFNVETNRWVVEPGAYKIQVGSSSKDLKLMLDINVN
jgi:beta-glucosidase